jgi:hypothetical protein
MAARSLAAPTSLFCFPANLNEGRHRCPKIVKLILFAVDTTARFFAALDPTAAAPSPPAVPKTDPRRTLDSRVTVPQPSPFQPGRKDIKNMKTVEAIGTDVPAMWCFGEWGKGARFTGGDTPGFSTWRWRRRRRHAEHV